MSYLRNCYTCARRDVCSLQAYFNHNKEVGCIDFQEFNYQTSISNTLNDNEEIEMSKARESLECFAKGIKRLIESKEIAEEDKQIYRTDYAKHYDMIKQAIDQAEDENVLKIIKEKRVNFQTFTSILEKGWSYEDYIDEENDRNTGGKQFANECLTEMEFNLIKRWLGDE